MSVELERKFNIIGMLIGNSLLFILECVTNCLMFAENKWACFKYYTDIANAFALFVSGVMVASCIIALIKNKPFLPKWVMVFKLISTTMLLITFTIVVTFLAPWFGTIGYLVFLFGGPMLFTHTVCPLFSIISFMTIERGYKYKFGATSFVILPTLVYGIIMIILNIFGVVVGPYPFFMVYRFHWVIVTLWCAGVILWSYLMSVICWLLSGSKARTVRSYKNVVVEITPVFTD